MGCLRRTDLTSSGWGAMNLPGWAKKFLFFELPTVGIHHLRPRATPPIAPGLG